MSKDTPTLVKRDIYTCQKRPLHMSKETLNLSKHTYIHVQESYIGWVQPCGLRRAKRDPYTCQQRHSFQQSPIPGEFSQMVQGLVQPNGLQTEPVRFLYMLKETIVHVKRDIGSVSLALQFADMSRENLTHVKRDHHSCQKRPILGAFRSVVCEHIQRNGYIC